MRGKSLTYRNRCLSLLEGLRPFMAVIDREETEEVVRQVGDVPRIGVAEPLTEWPLSLDLRQARNETTIASIRRRDYPVATAPGRDFAAPRDLTPQPDR